MQIACFDSQLTNNNCMQISPPGEGMTRRFRICIELLQREKILMHRYASAILSCI